MDNLLQPDPGLIFWTLIVFGIVVLLLKKFAWQPILNALDEREQSIRNSLDQAEKARKEMAELTSDNERILNEAKEERARIIKEAKETHESILGEAKEKAKVEASKIVADAAKEIETQKMAAITEVKNSVGNMAIDIAEKILKRELDDKVKQEEYASSLVEKFKLN